jgi:transcriptional regulator GlxA family with amidase domain
MIDCIVLLFPDFETLDVFGPVEVLGSVPEEFRLLFYSVQGGVITSSQKAPVMTKLLSELESTEYILFIPGGVGINPLITEESFIATLRNLASKATFVLTVCTGSLLLAKTGLLNGRRATTNKRRFDITKRFPKVDWIKKSRWVTDGNIYTSSGVSAGIDMALAFVKTRLGHDKATEICRILEYEWHEDSGYDPFSGLYPD